MREEPFCRRLPRALSLRITCKTALLRLQIYETKQQFVNSEPKLMVDFTKILQEALRDIRVELMDEFDRNFERKAFFTHPWAPAKADPAIGSLMNRHGVLRSSLHAEVRGSSVVFSSSTPYAEIHNEGGQVTTHVPVTPKMRRWAWAMFRQTGNEKYKGMALTKKAELSATFTMPQRQFIGEHPVVNRAVEQILDEHVGAFARELFSNTQRK